MRKENNNNNNNNKSPHNRKYRIIKAHSPMGYATKQEAYFAWCEDYDRWKEDTFGIPWGYRSEPPQWDDYWRDEEWIPYKTTSPKTNSSNNVGCMAFILFPIILISCVTIGYFL
jgi:hypothetical protein